MILPLRDSPRSATWPGVMVLIIVINVLVFIWELSLGAGQLRAEAGTGPKWRTRAGFKAGGQAGPWDHPGGGCVRG